MKKILVILLLSVAPLFGQQIVLTFTQEQLDAINWRLQQINADIMAKNAKILEHNALRKPIETNSQGEVIYDRPLLQTNKFMTVNDFIANIGQQCTNYFNRILKDIVDKKKEKEILDSIVVVEGKVQVQTNQVDIITERLKDEFFRKQFLDKVKNAKQ
jgi:hypothetical protein